MRHPLTLNDLTDGQQTLADLAGRTIQVWPDKGYTVHTLAFHLAQNCLDAAGKTFKGHIPVGPILLLQDDNTRLVAGDKVAASLTSAGFEVTIKTLPCAPGEHIEATGEAVDDVTKAVQAIEGVTGVVAVGSGTINDLCKMGSFRAGVPYAVCATAASMNGYTSPIAAILVDGIKRTLPCLPPLAVLADLDVVAAAPPELTQAGLGDLLSKPVSSGDWRLGHALNGDSFSEVPLVLVERAFRKVQAAAKGIGAGKPEAVGTLLEALVLSGISMACAGTSSPASGGEHLISHYWDMVAPFRGRHVGLHGAQVGVSTLVSATLYDRLRLMKPTPESIEARVQALAPIDSYAQAIASCPEQLREGIRKEVDAQYPSPDLLRSRMTMLMEKWDDIWADIDQTFQTASTLRSVLSDAGAPTTVKALGIPEWEMREAYLRARDIRARYTILDLAWEMGALDGLEDEVLSASGVLQ